MNASKENCRNAIKHLEKLVPALGPVLPIDFVFRFLEAAEKRLPTEAAIKKDRERRKPIPSRPF